MDLHVALQLTFHERFPYYMKKRGHWPTCWSPGLKATETNKWLTWWGGEKYRDYQQFKYWWGPHLRSCLKELNSCYLIVRSRVVTYGSHIVRTGVMVIISGGKSSITLGKLVPSIFFFHKFFSPLSKRHFKPLLEWGFNQTNIVTHKNAVLLLLCVAF